MKKIFYLVILCLISLQCNKKNNCNSFICIEEIELPEPNGENRYGKPAICLGLHITNDSPEKPLQIDANQMLYFINSANESVFLEKSFPSNSIFKIALGESEQFCLFLFEQHGLSLHELYEVLNHSRLYMEVENEETVVCQCQ